MTGFARAEGALPDGTLSWVWELRTVNGKGLDIRLRLPSGFESLEAKVRQAAADRLTRGNLNVALSVTHTSDANGYRVNEAFLDHLIAMAAEKASHLPPAVGQASLDGLMAVKGVVESADPAPKTEEDLSTRSRALLDGLSDAFDSLVEARSDEGRHLAILLSQQLDEMETLAAAAKSSTALQPAALKARLKSNVETLMDFSPALSEDRLVQEAALLVTKADVREELDRLNAHVAQGRELLAKGEPCGRRLEFLSQEFNREANTLCSKSSDVALTKTGLDLKAVIDQFREQIQNVE
tara:strand:- start:791 stop:1678 length:888 start_codon:yes stop_codon:yes gene_type:complete